MQPENWKNIKVVLLEALNLESSRRWSYLEEADISSEVREEIKSLLAIEEESENLMRLSAIEFSKDFFDSDDASQNSLVGQQIGVYEIVRELGYGGMGAVYLATRTDRKFNQKVALKLLKREVNTAALRRRFQQEREILAALEHPNIARLLDAGTTDDQIPFIVMEYVEGLPIDDFCNKHNLDLVGRLNLFRTVCSTVNFAHRNLIVHRDLKPSNILITPDGVPKLLDFGISKILSTEIEDKATITRLGVMTPSYASPEQLRSESVTTATDIYSLGVILYELLSGHRPFENKENDLKEIYQAIIDTDPPLPSAMVETISKTFNEISNAPTEMMFEENLAPQNKTRPNDFRRTAPHAISVKPQFLRGDLDNIVLKALKKEPERRYSSAENFAEDIKRHLDGLPVTARPDTFSYRAEKFIKRNSFSVLAGTLIFLAIIGGVAMTLWQARVAQAERTKAESRFKDVRKLANSYLFDIYPEIENLEGSLKAREKILTNALEYLDNLSNEANVDSELQSELATAYEKVGDVQGALNNSSLGNIKAGLESYEKARRLREAVHAANPANTEAKEKLANNYYTTARTLWNNSQTREAEEMFEKGLKLRRELVAVQPGSVEAQNRLAILLIDYGAIPVFNSQTEKALVLFDEALQIVETLRSKEPENSDFKKTLTRLLRIMSKAKGSIGDYEGALRGFAKAIEVSRELAIQFPKDFRVQRSVWLTNSMTCELFIDKGDEQKAVEICAPTIDFPKNALEKEPENGVVAYDLAISYFNTARAFRLAENPAKTIEHAEKAYEVMTRLIKKSPDNMEYKRNLAIYETEKARAQLKLNQFDKAAAVLQNTIETLIPIVEADKETTTYQYDLGMAYRLSAQASHQKGEKTKAIVFIDKAIDIFQNLRELNAIRDADKNIFRELEKEKADYAK
jgi:eukaryotic-like serine/threonine-protein kinase